ncbi:MAG: hypothetical protein L6Q66_06455 [Bacteroidia bacterium]|nr:hypothetical protein [Bacteroidia bacterium]
MVKLYDITNWNPQPWYNTGGTRAKKYIQSPEGKFYYFKQSEKKVTKDYKYEFWSEIIAYKLGTMLGLNILRYDIAIDGNKIGCICESMINRQNEELVEGGKYLNAYDSNFAYEEKKPGEKYTFQLINNAFEEFQIQKYMVDLLEVIVFDAIIGNGDRHQENWAFIAQHNSITKQFWEIDFIYKHTNFKDSLSGIWRRIFNWLYIKNTTRLKPNLSKAMLFFANNIKFSPIYDSGSSLGRELSEEKVMNLLSNQPEFEAYIKRGQSEIHWDGKKVSHFDIINKLKLIYPTEMNQIINRIKTQYKKDEFKKALDSIDNSVPIQFNSYKIPANRKELILKLITSRIDRL